MTHTWQSRDVWFATLVANLPRRNITMKYKLECQTYGSYLNAGAAMRDAIAKHLRKDNSLPDDLVDELSATHAAHYCEKTGFCIAEKNADGAWKFKDAEGKSHTSAQMQWGRQIDPHHKRVRSSRGGAHASLYKDPVAALLTAFYDLTAKQRAEFLARVK